MFSLLDVQEMQKFSLEVLCSPIPVRRVSGVPLVVLDQTGVCEDPQVLSLHCSAACPEGKIAEWEDEIWNVVVRVEESDCLLNCMWEPSHVTAVVSHSSAVHLSP